MLGGLLLLMAGCPTVTPEDEEPAANLSSKGVKLRLAVVDDPALAAAVTQLQGEWNAQTGAEFTVEPMSLKEFQAAKALEADAIVLPSADVGPLAVKKQIAKLPESLVASNSPMWTEIFSQLRVRETAWGSAPVAVPFGSPVLTVYYRADLLEKLGRKPPATWAEFQELSQQLADRTKLGDAARPDGSAWSGSLAPLGPGWAGQVLLARAAAYVTHRSFESTLFQIDTMEPLVDGEPFVRALTELVAAAGSSSEQLTYDPAAVRKAFWEGKCGMALTWPTAADKGVPEEAKIEVGFAELPGSPDVYNVANRAWEKRREDEDRQVPLVGVAGRMGVVSSKASRPDVAYQLLFWLSTDRWGRQVCSSTPATTMFRASQLESPQYWVEKPVSAAAAGQYATQTQRALCRTQRLESPRLPGRADYLAALDTAVQQAVRGEKKPDEALREAARRWREITNQLGKEAQKAAYWQSVGIE
jgi:multiple sugar transport system substrate-binding protein